MNALWNWDQALFKDVHIRWHERWLDPLFFLISSSGLGWVQLVLLIALLPLRQPLSDVHASIPARLRQTLWTAPPINVPLLLAWAIAGTVTPTLKTLIPRERPSNFLWAHPQELIFAKSFPSGHSSTSFAIAFTAFFLTRGGKHAKWGWLALLWAASVALSRVYRGVHWPSDVIGGCMVGLASAALVLLTVPSEWRTKWRNTELDKK